MGEKLYGFSCGHDTWKLQENLPVFQVSQKCSHLFIKDFHENVTNWNSLENFWNNRKYICVSFLFSSALSSRFNLNQELGSLFPCQPSRTSEHAVWKLLSSSKDTDEQCCMLWVCSEQFLLLCLAQYIHHVQHQHYLQHWTSLVKDKQIKRNRRQRMKLDTCLSSQDPEWPYYIWIFSIFCASLPAMHTLICWHISYSNSKPIDYFAKMLEYNRRSSCHKSKTKEVFLCEERCKVAVICN